MRWRARPHRRRHDGRRRCDAPLTRASAINSPVFNVNLFGLDWIQSMWFNRIRLTCRFQSISGIRFDSFSRFEIDGKLNEFNWNGIQWNQHGIESTFTEWNRKRVELDEFIRYEIESIHLPIDFDVKLNWHWIELTLKELKRYEIQWNQHWIKSI